MSIFNRIFQRGRLEQGEDSESTAPGGDEVDEKTEDTLEWPDEETTPTRVEPSRHDPTQELVVETEPTTPSRGSTGGEDPARERQRARSRPELYKLPDGVKAENPSAASRPARPPAASPPRPASSPEPTPATPAARSRQPSSAAAPPAPSGGERPSPAGTPSQGTRKAPPAPSRAPTGNPSSAQTAAGAGRSPASAQTGAARGALKRPPEPTPPPRRQAPPAPAAGGAPQAQRPAAEPRGKKSRAPNGRPKPDTGDIDALISEIETPREKGVRAEPEGMSSEADRAAVGQLFEELAVHYMAQLRDFMIEVRWGRALSEWIEAFEPVVRSLRDMAEQVEKRELIDNLDPLLSEMKSARSSGAEIDGPVKDALLRAYQPLIDAMPKAFALEEERNRREPIIVRSTLLQIEGVEKVTLDKLQAAGVMSIPALAGAVPRDLADATGISIELAERIRDRFRDHQKAGAVSVAAPSRSEEIRALAALVDTLEQKHRQYEEAAQGWSRDAKAKKRRARRERAEALLRVHVSLARLGEIDRLVALDRLPFSKKIEELAAYLRQEEARRKHG